MLSRTQPATGLVAGFDLVAGIGCVRVATCCKLQVAVSLRV